MVEDTGGVVAEKKLEEIAQKPTEIPPMAKFVGEHMGHDTLDLSYRAKIDDQGQKSIFVKCGICGGEYTE